MQFTHHIILLVNIVLFGLSLMYNIIMILYLGKTQTCDKYLSKRDIDFRRIAYVLTWISAVFSGMTLLGLVISLIKPGIFGNFGKNISLFHYHVKPALS